MKNSHYTEVMSSSTLIHFSLLFFNTSLFYLTGLTAGEDLFHVGNSGLPFVL